MCHLSVAVFLTEACFDLKIFLVESFPDLFCGVAKAHACAPRHPTSVVKDERLVFSRPVFQDFQVYHCSGDQGSTKTLFIAAEVQ